MGLLGPNGAGKTTTVRLLTTVVAPTSGSFTVAGVTALEPSEVRRRVGALPESAGYPGQLTGRAYLRRHAQLFGLPRQRASEVARDLLVDVGLAERGDSLIRTYSRGMRQRLGIARALVNDPAVVLLDETTLGLDRVPHAGVVAGLRGTLAVAATRRTGRWTGSLPRSTG